MHVKSYVVFFSNYHQNRTAVITTLLFSKNYPSALFLFRHIWRCFLASLAFRQNKNQDSWSLIWESIDIWRHRWPDTAIFDLNRWLSNAILRSFSFNSIMCVSFVDEENWKTLVLPTAFGKALTNWSILDTQICTPNMHQSMLIKNVHQTRIQTSIPSTHTQKSVL